MDHRRHGRSSTERPEWRAARLARRQHGLITRSQAFDTGIGRGYVEHALRSGRWELVQRGVYRLASAERTWHQRQLAAVLAAGDAVASHRAGARLWQVAGFTGPRVEILTPSEQRRVPTGTVVHRTRHLPAFDRTTKDRIPVTTPERTLVDLAAITTEGRLEDVLDDMLVRQLVSVGRLARRLREAKRGTRGLATLKALLEVRSQGSAPESVLERRLLGLIAAAGLPEPVVQHRIVDGEELIARVDLAYPACRLAIEADGYRWHEGRRRFDRDRVRLSRLAARGWRVLVVTWTQLEREPDAVVARVAAALAACD